MKKKRERRNIIRLLPPKEIAEIVKNEMMKWRLSVFTTKGTVNIEFLASIEIAYDYRRRRCAS